MVTKSNNHHTDFLNKTAVIIRLFSAGFNQISFIAIHETASFCYLKISCGVSGSLDGS